MKRITILIILISTTFFAFSQTKMDSLISLLSTRGEAVISFDKEIANINKKNLEYFDFDKIENNRIYFYVNRRAIESVDLANLDFKIEPIPSLQTPIQMANSLEQFFGSWDTYPSYSQYTTLMQKFATDYPQLCKYHILGTLPSGRQIIAVQLGDSVNIDQNEPKFLYTATMHGDETVGYVLTLRLIEYLLENYQTNAKVKYLMDNVEIWINPLANPDGTYHTGNSTVSGATRYNMNNVDLNRNYPDPEDGLHPDGKVYQAETQIFMDFAENERFTLAANLHSGVEVVNYPWDTWAKYPADSSWWVHVSKMFADTAQANSPAGYFTKFGTGYTNGYQWYSVWGGRQDYMNYFLQCREFVLELSNTKLLPENQLQAFWNYLYPSFLNYIAETTYGIQGRVTDSVTTKGLMAKIEVLNHDIDSSLVFSNDSGYYYRPIDTGSYTIKVSAAGYYSKIKIVNHQYLDSADIFDVQLVKDPFAINTSNLDFDMQVFPNPSSGFVSIKSSVLINSIEIFDIFGKQVFDINRINAQLITFDASLNKGIYFIRLSTPKGVVSKKIIIF